MKFQILIYVTLFLVILSLKMTGQEVLQWRGSDRSGIFQETKLLTLWPKNGPNLLWEYEGIGNGYGSPVITSDQIFVNGETDTVSYLYAFEISGEYLWKSKIGKEWIQSYPGARTTPTVVGDLVYVTAGMGAVACFDAISGNEKWSVEMMKDFHGQIPRFGFSESVLIDGDQVFCMPGGRDTNVVALDRFTGKINWICKGNNEMPSYCSPLLIKLRTKNILVSFSRNSLLGIDVNDGKLLWSHKQTGDGDVHVNTPIFENGFIYYITGNGNGAVKLKLSDDGTEITEIWRNPYMDNCMGAFIKVGNYIYSSGYEIRNYKTMDAVTGKLLDSLKFDRGTINYADGLLYLYNEKGQLGLCKPDGSKMNLICSFKLTKGTKAHYAHPVICNGTLYIRHGNSLLAYDIKAK